MGQARLKKYNTLSTGFMSGIMLPLFVLLIIYLARYSSGPLHVFIASLLEMNLLFKLLSLFGFLNLLLFFLFYRSRMDKAARGVVMATFIYALLVLLSRWL